MEYFPPAPWPRCLKLTSCFGVLVVLGAGYGAWRSIPPGGFAHVFGSFVTCVPLLLGLGSVLFIVAGYSVDFQRLYVRRLLWSTVVSLEGLKQVWHDPSAIRCSGRIFGNAGFFCFTGLYQNAKVGRFRMFATDPARAVVLVLPKRSVVVTPADPQAFVLYIERFFPHAEVIAPGRGTSPRA